MDICDKMRAQSVKRWHTVDTARPQSVAEHSFNLVMLAREIWKRSNLKVDRVNHLQMVLWALKHDLHEIHDGDIPAPAKGKVFDLPTGPEELIVKLADLIEAHWFISEFGVGSYAEETQILYAERINDYMRQVEDGYARTLAWDPYHEVKDIVTAAQSVHMDLLKGEYSRYV